MERIEVSINEDVLDVIRKIRTSPSSEVEIFIPENSVLFENSLNLKLLEKEASKSGKNINFLTDDPVGKNLIEMLDPTESERVNEEAQFISEKRFETPIVKVPFKIALPALALPKLHFNMKWFGLLGILILICLPLYFLLWVLPFAKVILVVNSQPLVKSVTVKLSTSQLSADAKGRVVPGRVLEASISATGQTETTGEKLVGEKAKGEVTIYNKTVNDKKFSKGTTISLVSTKEALKFLLDEEVTVSKRTEATPSYEPGKKKVKVTAFDIGSKYNLADSKNFKIGSLDTDDYIAINDSDFSQGSSKTVKAVSQEDRNRLSESAFSSGKTDALNSLKGKLSKGQKLLDSTVVYKKVSETFDKNLLDEADKLSVTQSISSSGIYYLVSDLQTLLDALLNEFVPEGFELSKKDSEIEVGVLTGTGTPSSEIELQVKIKAFVVPKVNADEVKKKLQGLNVGAAKEYLAGIKNIKSYEIDLSPKLLAFLQKFPRKEDRIEVEVKRE